MTLGQIESSGMQRRTFLQAVGAAGAVGLLAGCSAGASSGAAKLNFWLPPNSTPENMKAFTGRMAAGYKKVAPKNSLTSLIIPWESALTKYTAAFSSSNPPDVTYQIVPWLNKWRSTGVLADFNKMATKEELSAMTKGAPEAYLTAARGPNGELYAVPFIQGFWPLALNEDIWEKAGKPPFPTTFADMIPFAQAMTLDKKGRKLGESGYDARSVAHWGMNWSSATASGANYVWQYLWAYGSDYISADRKDIGFDNDEGRAALKVMKDMIDSGAATPPGLSSDVARWDNMLVGGRSGMAWTANFTEAQCKQFPNTRLKVLDLPSGPKSKVVVGGCGYYAVSAKSKNKRQAFELAKFLLSPTQADDYVRMVLLQPTRPVESGFYSKPLADPRMNKFLNEASSYTQFARSTLVLPYQPQEYLLGKINDYLYGKQSLDAMIAQASKGIQQMSKTAS